VRRLSPAGTLLVFLAVAACNRRVADVDAPDPPLPDGPPILFPSDTPDTLLDKAIAALGGEKRLTRWKCGRVKYETRSDTIPLLERPSTVEEYFQLPGHFKRVAEVGQGNRRRIATFIINGERGAELLPDGTTRPLPDMARFDGLRSEHAFADFYNLTRLRAPHYSLSVRGEEVLDGRSAIVLHCESTFTNPMDYAFDSATALLVKSTRHLPQPAGGEKIVEIFLGDYRDLGGGVVPLHIKGRSEGKVLLDFTIFELELLDQLDDSIFEIPP
jgi:hypothetical protein